MNKSQSLISNISYEALNELCETQELMSYNNMCKKLNIETKDGNSKIKQLKELASICEYEKIGTKYRINKIATNKEVLLFNNRSIYLPYIEMILLSAFDKSKGDTLYLSTKELVVLCNMINQNYKALLTPSMFTDSLKVAQKNNFDHESFYGYLDKSYNSILKPIMGTALKSMENRKSISLNKGVKLYKNIGKGMTRYTYAQETDPIGKEIFKIEGDTFTELGINGVTDLYGKKAHKKTQFYKLCNKKVKEYSENNQLWKDNFWDYDGYYRCHAIILNENRIKTNIQQLRGDLNFKVQERLLNTVTLDFLTNIDRKIYIQATIDSVGIQQWNFKEDIEDEEE